MRGKETWTISCCALGSGFLIALGVRWVTGLSLWIGLPVAIPASVLLWGIAWRAFDRALDRQNQRLNTPLTSEPVEGVGTMITYVDRVEIELEVSLESHGFQRVSLCLDEHPSELMLNAIMAIPQRLKRLRQECEDALRRSLENQPGEFQRIQLDESSLALYQEDAQTWRLEFGFNVKDEPDLGYHVVFEDRRVIDVYAAD